MVQKNIIKSGMLLAFSLMSGGLLASQGYPVKLQEDEGKEVKELRTLLEELPIDLKLRVYAYLYDGIPGAIGRLILPSDFMLYELESDKEIGLTFSGKWVDKIGGAEKQYTISRPFAFQSSLQSKLSSKRTSKKSTYWAMYNYHFGNNSIAVYKGEDLIVKIATDLSLSSTTGSTIVNEEGTLVAAMNPSRGSPDIYIFDTFSKSLLRSLEVPEKFEIEKIQFVSSLIAGHTHKEPVLMVAGCSKGNVVVHCYAPLSSDKPLASYRLQWPGFTADRLHKIRVFASKIGMLIAPRWEAPEKNGWNILFVTTAQAPSVVGKIHPGYSLGSIQQSACGTWAISYLGRFSQNSDEHSPEAMIQVAYLRPLGCSLKDVIQGQVPGADPERGLMAFVGIQERMIALRARGFSLPPAGAKTPFK